MIAMGHREKVSVRANLFIAVVMTVAALTSGCDAVSSKSYGVSDPLTPEQSKTQVVDAAREIVQTLKLDTSAVVFRRSSCNDQHEAPFRGVVRIKYPLASSFEASGSEVEQMVQQLKSNGWGENTDFKTHASSLAKNQVVAVFNPQAKGTVNRSIELYGECRDVTTTKDSAGTTEHVDLG